jgi:hypothetical protein
MSRHKIGLKNRTLKIGACILVICILYACQKEEKKSGEANFSSRVMKTGLRDGEYTDTLGEGKLIRKAVYANGRIMEVLWQRDSAGRTLESGDLKEGNGVLYLYTPAGKLFARQAMQQGVPHGTTETLDTAGNVIAWLEYRYGVLLQSRVAGCAEGQEPSKKNVHFDTKETDKVMAQFKAGNSDALYQNLLNEYKKQETPASFKRYLAFLKELYGDLREYKMETYNLVKNANLGEGAEVLYICKFAYCKGAIAMRFFKEKDQFKLADFSVQTEPYTPITQITRIGNPILDALKAGNFNDIYNAASERFKGATPKNQFDAMIEKFRQMGSISAYQLYQHQVGLAQGKIVAVMIYEVTIGGKEHYFELSMTEQSPNKFILEGLQLVK